MVQALMISLKVLAIDMPLLTLLGRAAVALAKGTQGPGAGVTSVNSRSSSLLGAGTLPSFSPGQFSFFQEAGLLFAFPPLSWGTYPFTADHDTGSRAALPVLTVNWRRPPWPRQKALGGFLGVTLPLPGGPCWWG